MPVPTVTAKAANALSIAGAASGALNALASAPFSVETAPETAAEAGMIPVAQFWTALAQPLAHAAALCGGFENTD